ncbi:colicin immunity protein [Leclercia tamurae]|uniref:Colicin immunity protein n=1 Tax=Leclercia tamurae TaxID=2926467 RepID=A0ABT2R7Y7_9ENTR|nr:colicin immunity protein [Leclercia tamurae]MCU6676973.1 colicin immunity protein [Leclercia tamurae]
MKSQIDKENLLGKRMILTLLPAISPFIIILLIYFNNPESDLISAMASWGSELPAVTSAKNPLLSKAMDLYTKTAPFVAALFFMTSFKLMSIKKDHSNTKLIGTLLLYYVFYFCITYPFLFCNQELTTSGRLLRLMSENDIFLTFFYSSLYAGLFVLTVMVFWFTIGVCNALKER